LVEAAGLEPESSVPPEIAESAQNLANPKQDSALPESPSPAPETKTCISEHASLHCSDTSAQPNNATFMPDDLAQVVDAWDTLPDAVKAGILAMVNAARPKGK